MTVHSVVQIIRELNEASVQYLIVGGLAVVAHGYVRLTADVDLVLNLKESNEESSWPTTRQRGYRAVTEDP